MAAIAALGDNEHLQCSRQVNRENMVLLRNALDQMGLHYFPSVGNVLCVDMGRPGLVILEALLCRGVTIRPVANYGLPNFLRITIGTERENRKLIETLREVL